MHQLIHTSEHPVAAMSISPGGRDVLDLEAARRPGCRPTEYWSFRGILRLVEADQEPEEDITGVGAVTEMPHGWTRRGHDAA